MSLNTYQIGMQDLDRIVAAVQSLRPGQRIRFSRLDMHLIPGMQYNGGSWSASDRVLSNVMGAMHGWSYDLSLTDGSTTFCRAGKDFTLRDGEATFVDPDRRRYYDRGSDGIWRRNSLEFIG